MTQKDAPVENHLGFKGPLVGAQMLFVAFGALVLVPLLTGLDPNVALFTAGAGTLLFQAVTKRMVPVFLALAGMNLRADEKLFMGWFGPRGLASIVFAVIVLDKHLPGGGTISMTVVCTIVLSVILHGLSANPLVAALGARIRRSQGEEAIK